jgi:hypothetical protein
MLYIKRYDLLKDDKGFKLQYKKEVIRLDTTNWDDADIEAQKIIDKLRKENTENNLAIVFD